MLALLPGIRSRVPAWFALIVHWVRFRSEGRKEYSRWRDGVGRLAGHVVRWDGMSRNGMDGWAKGMVMVFLVWGSGTEVLDECG